MDREKRYAATHILDHLNVTLTHIYMDLDRVTRIQQDGLTPKEKAALEKQVLNLRKTSENIAKIKDRTRRR